MTWLTKLIDCLLGRRQDSCCQTAEEHERLKKSRQWAEDHQANPARLDLIDKYHVHDPSLGHVRDIDHEAARYMFHTSLPQAPDSLVHAGGGDENRYWTGEGAESAAGAEGAGAEERKKEGGAIVEGVAALVVLLPLAFLIIFGVVEVVHYFHIRNGLTEAANRAVRSLSVEYWKDEDVASDRGLQDSRIFDQIRIPGVVNSSSQFGNIHFNLGGTPQTVTVTVTYQGGQNGLPPFPDPDPLGMGSGYQITVSATHAIE